MIVFKNWIKLFFIFFILSLISVMFFNFHVDSLSIFGNKSYLSKAIDDLLLGKRVAGLGNFDDRLFHSLLIKKNKKKVDTILLGSSRAMVTRKKSISTEDKVFFNHAVSGASLEDYMAMVDLYEDRQGYIPKNVIIGVDPWVFNKFNGRSRWRTLKKNYFSLRQRIMDKVLDTKLVIDSFTWKQLINYEYTIANIIFFKKSFNQKAYYLTSSVDIEDSVRDIDGSLYYPLSHRTPGIKEVERLAIEFTKAGKVYSLEKFDELSNRDEFENFISYLKQKGTMVTFVLYPYNPISYDRLIDNKDYVIIRDVEYYLKQFSQKNKIKLLGSYNPHKFNFKSKDFTDGMHGLENVSEIIFEEL